jgi:hypothetical protein
MDTVASISATTLRSLIGTPRAPLVFDVREARGETHAWNFPS